MTASCTLSMLPLSQGASEWSEGLYISNQRVSQAKESRTGSGGSGWWAVAHTACTIAIAGSTQPFSCTRLPRSATHTWPLIPLQQWTASSHDALIDGAVADNFASQLPCGRCCFVVQVRSQWHSAAVDLSSLSCLSASLRLPHWPTSVAAQRMSSASEHEPQDHFIGPEAVSSPRQAPGTAFSSIFIHGLCLTPPLEQQQQPITAISPSSHQLATSIHPARQEPI